MNSPYDDREQTQVKHQILERYLSAFVPIVGNWAGDIVYVDCLAGPWQSVDPNMKDTSFGRAVDVLRSTRKVLANRGKSPSIRCLFIEKDPDAFQKLKRFCDEVKDIEVTPKNWDFTTHIGDIVQFVQKRAKTVPFFFIDPTGWEPLAIELITPLLSLEPGEVLVNLMTSWIRRFLSVEAKHFDRLLGSDLPRLRQLQGDEQEEELVTSYKNALVTAGKFQYACTLPVLKSSQDAFHFHMIYATRNIKGVQVFKETERAVIPFMHNTRANAQARRRLEESGQQSFFDAAAHYQEQRFTEYSRRSVTRAKLELRKLLEGVDRVSLEEAWQKAMQHSTVEKGDFRQWLTEWKSDGLLRVVSRHSGPELPKEPIDKYLEWIKR
jgi:three-Cys-motif partner protein